MAAKTHPDALIRPDDDGDSNEQDVVEEDELVDVKPVFLSGPSAASVASKRGRKSKQAVRSYAEDDDNDDGGGEEEDWKPTSTKASKQVMSE